MTGVHVEISNTDHDDFINLRSSITATHTDGTTLRWTLPDRLLQHTQVCEIVQHEILAALDEKVAQLKRLRDSGVQIT